METAREFLTPQLEKQIKVLFCNKIKKVVNLVHGFAYSYEAVDRYG